VTLDEATTQIVALTAELRTHRRLIDALIEQLALYRAAARQHFERAAQLQRRVDELHRRRREERRTAA